MVRIWGRSSGRGNRGEVNHWKMLYLYLELCFILGWMMPPSVPSQFSPGKALVEQEKGGAPFQREALELQRVPCYCLGMEHLFIPLAGNVWNANKPQTARASNTHGWLASWLSENFSTFFWMNLRKKVLTYCMEGEGRRKQSRAVSFAVLTSSGADS